LPTRFALKRKGQALASDFAISIVLFLFLIVGSAIVWNTTVEKYSRFKDGQFMQEKVFSISDTLVRTQGYPPEWNITNVRLIGLSEGESHMLNRSKLLVFKNIDYSLTKNIWGINGYEYYAAFTNSTGGLMSLDGTALEYGLLPTGKRDLAPLKRLVLINESGNITRASLTFMIWR
jgi:hypothetical protein